MMKKLKIIIILLLIFTTCGCGDYRELSDMSIVASIGIDKKDQEYILVSQVLNANPKTSGKSEEKASSGVVIYISTGKTVHEALRNTLLQSPKKLYVGHLQTVIISENLAKEDVTGIFDFFLRDAEASKDFKILMAKDHSITDIMSTLTPLETIPAQNISFSIEAAAEFQGSVGDVTFDEFVSNYLKPGIDSVIPIISIEENETTNEETNPSKRLVILKEMGIFNNKNFLTYLSDSSSLGYNIINGNVNSNVISFKCEDNKYGSIEMLKNKSKLSFDIDTDTLILEVKIKGAISELDCNVAINNEEEIKKIEKKAEEEITKIMNETIDSAIQYNKSDFLGIGLSIFQNHYKYYQANKEHMSDIIKNMNRKISVKVIFTQKGSIKEGDEKY